MENRGNVNVMRDADRHIAEIHFVSAAALSTNSGLRHLLIRSELAAITVASRPR
jgi:hypothetical protein